MLQGKAKLHDDDGLALENDADEQEVLIMRQIVKNFTSCAEHPKKACYVTNNGPHYAFTAGDLSIWAGLVVSVCSIAIDFYQYPHVCF